MTPSRAPSKPESGRILLASSRDWLSSALLAVLEPAGFTFEHRTTAAEALERVVSNPPDVLIIDEGLPDRSVPELCRDLTERGGARGLPILVYSPTLWHASEQAAALRAGAWDIVREPIRSTLLLAKLGRLIQIKRLIEASGGVTPDAADEHGPLALPELFRFLPVIGSIASRAGEPIGCAVLGPTCPFGAAARDERRSETAELVARLTRRSDLYAWLGDSDLAIVAYGAGIEGLGTMVERLARAASAEGREEPRWSAGLVQIRALLAPCTS
ncbi:MAG: response regulator, partial [Gemmatimonadota bacterium]